MVLFNVIHVMGAYQVYRLMVWRSLRSRPLLSLETSRNSILMFISIWKASGNVWKTSGHVLKASGILFRCLELSGCQFMRFIHQKTRYIMFFSSYWSGL